MILEYDLFYPPEKIILEDQFIKMLENKDFDEFYIGRLVCISNFTDYNNGLWIIADVDHNSSITKQTNYYDLISLDCFMKQRFGDSNSWESSSIRSYLNDNLYNGFSEAIKEHMMIIIYKEGYTTVDREEKVIIPSTKEIQFISEDYYDGVTYPIFRNKDVNVAENYLDSTNCRSKYVFKSSTLDAWWTRSKSERSFANRIDIVTASGSIQNINPSYEAYVSPIIRLGQGE